MLVIGWTERITHAIESAVYRGLKAGIVPLIHTINDLKGYVMASVDELNTAIDGVYESLLPAVNELRDELSELREKAQADNITPEDLSSSIARLSGVSNRVRDALNDLITNDETPEPVEELPDLPQPLPEEPPVVSTPDPEVPISETEETPQTDSVFREQ